MKKLFLTLIGLIVCGGIVLADQSQRVTFKEVNMDTRNLVVTLPNDPQEWLLHWNGCGTMSVGQQMTLNIVGVFDGVGETLLPSEHETCKVDEAKKINARLLVSKVYDSDSTAVVTDKNGVSFTVGYTAPCRGIDGFRGKTIYANQGMAGAVGAGDQIYLPGDTGFCALRSAFKVKTTPATTPASAASDRQAPSTVNHVRGAAGKGKAYVYWYAATDNVGVDHYVVGYGYNKVNPLTAPVKGGLPYEVSVTKNQATLTGLQNDRDIYFYVLAVDAAGNRSSQWSQGIMLRPLSAIAPTADTGSGTKSLALTIAGETDKDITIAWTRPIGTLHTVVTLDADGVRDFAKAEYYGKSIVIEKTPARQGKNLTIHVKVYDLHGLLLDQKIDFSF